MEDLSLVEEREKRPVGLLERVRARPVQEVQVDPIGAEPAEAALARGLGPRMARVLREDLRDEEYLIPLAGDRFRDELLGPATGVHLRGVDERQAEVEAAAQRRDLLGASGRVLAHGPRAEPETRKRRPRSRPHLESHGALTVPGGRFPRPPPTTGPTPARRRSR